MSDCPSGETGPWEGVRRLHGAGGRDSTEDGLAVGGWAARSTASVHPCSHHPPVLKGPNGTIGKSSRPGCGGGPAVWPFPSARRAGPGWSAVDTRRATVGIGRSMSASSTAGVRAAVDTCCEPGKQQNGGHVRLIHAGASGLQAQREDLVQVVLVKVKELRTRGSFSV